jgi:hypothetical protein
MQRTSILLGILIGVGAVVGVVGASSVVDSLQGPEITDVTVDRLNDTHAAVAWSTEQPTRGYVDTLVSQHCPPGWGTGVNTINDSSFTRTHLVIAPIYELNTSQVNLSKVRGNGSLKQYEVQVSVWNEEETTADYRTIVKRNLSQACQ